MSRKLFLLWMGTLLGCVLPVMAADKATPPNIVFILVDDMGTGDLSCYGSPDVKTPTVDRLARQGIRFTQFYSNGAECTPARTAILTGRYTQRVGGLECAIGTGNVGRYDDADRLAKQHDLGLPASEATLAPALKKAGYRTAIFGKWHLGYEDKFHPFGQGFDEFVGFTGGNVDYFTHTELSDLPVYFNGRKPIERKGYMTHLITDDAVDFIARNKSNPFFLYLPYSVPHFPFQGPNDDTGKMYPAEEFTSGTREKYLEMIVDMDQSVARVLKALDDSGLADNTVVAYASDHGAMKPGRNLPFSGFKGGLQEGGIRIPCIVRWPGHILAGTESDQVGTMMDLTASFLRIGGVDTSKLRLDGTDVLYRIESRQPSYERVLFWRARRGDRTWRAVRDGSFKYLSKVDGGTREEWLYNVLEDPSESHDLLAAKPDLAKQLEQRLTLWEEDVKPTR